MVLHLTLYILILSQVIYSQESCPKDEFVAGVQDIISALNQLANQISQGSGFSGALLNQQASKKDLRLSISLYTILYQVWNHPVKVESRNGFSLTLVVNHSYSATDRSAPDESNP